MKPKNSKPKCPTCKYAMRYVFMRDYNGRVKLGFYCSGCKKIKLKPGVKLIHAPIFKGLNEVYLMKLEKIRVYCTKCDQDMVSSGIALDHPNDGTFFICEKCHFRIVIFGDE